MKKFLCLSLAVMVLLSGCASAVDGIREPVTFYYPRAQYRYGTPDAVIAGQQREGAGHSGELSYFLALYLMGPADEQLISPLPRGTRVYQTQVEGDEATVTLSDTAKTLTDPDFTLACACLAMTAMDITGVTQVTIVSGDRSATMAAENLLLTDDSAAAETTEETQ